MVEWDVIEQHELGKPFCHRIYVRRHLRRQECGDLWVPEKPLKVPGRIVRYLAGQKKIRLATFASRCKTGNLDRRLRPPLKQRRQRRSHSLKHGPSEMFPSRTMDCHLFQGQILKVR